MTDGSLTPGGMIIIGLVGLLWGFITFMVVYQILVHLKFKKPSFLDWFDVTILASPLGRFNFVKEWYHRRWKKFHIDSLAKWESAKESHLYLDEHDDTEERLYFKEADAVFTRVIYGKASLEYGYERIGEIRHAFVKQE